jgi:hypothetical protein
VTPCAATKNKHEPKRTWPVKFNNFALLQ